MKKVFLTIILLYTLILTSSCASNEPESDAHPYADIEGGFMAQEPRTVRDKEFAPNDFFFKQCDQSFSETYYSRTSYFCNDR